MRPLLFLLLFTGYLLAQDSLFWFDMNSVRDPVPKTPKILDKIFGTSQFGLLDSLKNIRITTQEGYRLQIFESSSVEETNRTLRKFERSLKDSVYMVFEAPLYKLRLGNFVTKKEAEKQKENLKKKGYKNIWIVRSRIEQSSKNLE
tara:strand:- start:85 stop:522 length:438 start_codon:yes stop_codon:yes gene_type:complete